MGFGVGVAVGGHGQITVRRLFLSRFWLLQLLRPEAHKELTIGPAMGARFAAADREQTLLHVLLSLRFTATSGGGHLSPFLLYRPEN